jgi:hypothetical protein
MQNITLTPEEFNALIAEREALRGELRMVTVERDLLLALAATKASR